jgi:phosphopantothenate synthetase
MATLTLAIDDGLLTKTELLARERGTTLDQLIREKFEEFVEPTDSKKASTARLLSLIDRARSSSSGQRDWTREELHER